MPWKRLIDGLEKIVGLPGPDGIALDSDRLGKIRALYKSLGISRLRSRDIADSYLALVPDKRRRGKGVYYTPSQVVEFISEQVVPQPRIVKGKKVAPYQDDFTLLEPACGSGYFLLSTFSNLRNSYRKAGFSGKSAVRRILSRHLAGVDIDSGALLASMAGLIQEAGDDLHDALASEPLTLRLFDADFLDKNRDGENSEYGRLLADGVSAIVGNPPYVSFYAKRANTITAQKKEYYKSHYLMGKGRINTYCLFIERAFDLLNPTGVLGFIVPNTVLIMKSYEPLRTYLLENGWLRSIVDLSLKVFPEVEVPTCVLAVEKRDTRALAFPRSVKAGFWTNARGKVPDDLEDIDQNDFRKYPYTMFNIHVRSADTAIIEAIERVSKPLGDQFEVRDGINPANMTGKLVVRSSEALGVPFRKVLRGKDITAFQLSWDSLWVRYDPKFADRDKGEYCFLREERIFTQSPKILTRQTADRIVAALDYDGFYALNTLHCTLPLNGGMDLKCLLALYNSRLVNYYYRLVFPDTEKVFPQVKTVNVEKLPLPVVGDVGQKLIELVDQLLDLRTVNSKIIKKRENLLDEIDNVVYSLYELNPRQVARIENSTGTRTAVSI